MFGKKTKKHHNPYSPSQDRGEPDGGYEGDNRVEQGRTPIPNAHLSAHEDNNVQPDPKPKLTFHCQQAQGSPTGIISGFTNVKELYQKIAVCYDLKPSDILFCTLNTHKIDMKMLLGGQIGLDDFIFAHVKGQNKEIQLEKTQEALGLTITDNGAGIAFIKRIKDGSVISNCPHIKVGDHIEKLNGVELVGCRHFEVAKALKEIPKDSTFTIRLVEPLSSWADIGPRSNKTGSKSVKNGMKTLRFRANESAVIEDVDDKKMAAQDKINQLLENFMGINDEDLASQIYDLGITQSNTLDFAEAIDDSDLGAFGFTDDFIFELWGAITDVKSGRV
ncbi:hypothetical protein TCAL_01631 [Tigriopus californicus]|uniref:PDZ domain-containing protein n=1 Tax=Tigriopus californicus TaxID=6832 RepID=A0A553PDI5_TIGCA|nr:PDZ domain-containing protein GIPC3-like [Tigriopus californicus]TRY75748.1 hypothetical protein TCAL_01631 [Tigriopus californicus]|eukprot:TCALIF_01631-PA protein Name:"Similar to Gipc1 PDZ domain-containing protein GIPC1 (Rattus norvegicus)" AED:0.07 eAED:0.07 QI:647/0.8/0.66/1/1/1/6/264/332